MTLITILREKFFEINTVFDNVRVLRFGSIWVECATTESNVLQMEATYPKYVSRGI
jgi:hypothetical protein